MECTQLEIAWMAGLFEGEAYFGIEARAKTRYKVSTAPAAPFIKISMVDEDIISKVAKLLNKSYFSPSRKTITKKTVYTLHVGDRATLSYLYPRLFPYLGARRQKSVQKGIDLLNSWELWYKKGGRSEMAKQGALAKKVIFMKDSDISLSQEKSMISKSKDMISPDVVKEIRKTNQ